MRPISCGARAEQSPLRKAGLPRPHSLPIIRRAWRIWALWKMQGMTIERVKEEPQKESERAAAIFGAEIRFFDSGDYPIKASEETIHAMVVEYRKLQPEVILTHSYEDPYNPDHPYANMLTLQTRVYAQAAGYPARRQAARRPSGLHLSNRISPSSVSSSRKCCSTSRRCRRSKKKPWSRWKRKSTSVEYYRDLAKRRGTQAVRNCGSKKGIKYAEAYQRVYPQVASEFS